MKLVVGLGNPGKEYENTRHNAGFLVVDNLLSSKLPGGTVIKKSDVFMNDSGSFVKALTIRYFGEASFAYSLNNLYIVHDDLDIKLGEYKIQFGRGPKDHNGLKSIDDVLGTNQYWHVKIGIDNRPERMGLPSFAKATAGEKYVLQNFTDEERKILDGVIREACKKLVTSLINTN